jgi:hypothetical protein
MRNLPDNYRKLKTEPKQLRKPKNAKRNAKTYPVVSMKKMMRVTVKTTTTPTTNCRK